MPDIETPVPQLNSSILSLCTGYPYVSHMKDSDGNHVLKNVYQSFYRSQHLNPQRYYWFMTHRGWKNGFMDELNNLNKSVNFLKYGLLRSNERPDWIMRGPSRRGTGKHRNRTIRVLVENNTTGIQRIALIVPSKTDWNNRSEKKRLFQDVHLNCTP